MPSFKRAFSTVELLTVVVILAIIAAILFPILAKARSAADKAGCVSNLRQLGVISQLYAQDHDDQSPGVSVNPSNSPVNAAIGDEPV